MTSFIQFIKMLKSGNTPQGIKCRTLLSIFLTVSVIILEFVIYYTNWDSIPDMIQYDYDFSGQAHDIFEKKWIWYNLLLQIIICAGVFIAKRLLYKTKRVHRIVYDEKNKLIPIINKRFTMFAWEISMLFVTTEQGYIFSLVDIVKDRTADDIVTGIFLFWLIVLILEFRYDIKLLKAKNKNSK